MLTRRLNQAFKVCSKDDPAFLEMDDRKLLEYITTRDVDKLEIDKLDMQPTIFLVFPLKQEFEHLPEQAAISAQETNWRIFKNHVAGVQNFTDENGNEVVVFEQDVNGKRVVKDSCRENIPMAIVNEISMVIVEKAAKGDYSPFSMPRTFHQDRRRQKNHRALLASLEGVSK